MDRRDLHIGACLAGMIEVSPRRLSCLAINSTGGKPFASEDVALLEALMTPMQRALEIHRRLAGAELMALHASAVLDRLPHGVVFVSLDGRVLGTNRAADEMTIPASRARCRRAVVLARPQAHRRSPQPAFTP